MVVIRMHLEFWCWIMKCVNIWKVGMSQRSNHFQMNVSGCFKLTHGLKIYSECMTDRWILIWWWKRSCTWLQILRCNTLQQPCNHLSSSGAVPKSICHYLKKNDETTSPLSAYISVQGQIFFIWFNQSKILHQTDCRGSSETPAVFGEAGL